jgi:hypothetical protein
VEIGRGRAGDDCLADRETGCGEKGEGFGCAGRVDEHPRPQQVDLTCAQCSSHLTAADHRDDVSLPTGAGVSQVDEGHRQHSGVGTRGAVGDRDKLWTTRASQRRRFTVVNDVLPLAHEIWSTRVPDSGDSRANS